MLSRIGSIGSLSLSLSLLLASACGGGGGGGGPGPDAGLDAATDAPPAPFLTEVDCANPGPPGTGIAPGAALHKFTLDDDPLAVCNDGSPGVMYVRAAANQANRGRWLFHLQGGGACGADFEQCRNRWCSAGDGAGQQRSKMTSTLAPQVMTEKGLWLRDPANLFGDANHVFLLYCSSDTWAGQASDVTLTNPDDPAERFRLHFRGHDIVVAAFAALRAGTLVSDDGAVTMPDLDSATEALITGTSAGAVGVTHHGDFLAGQFAAGADVWLVFDATLGADLADIPDPAIRAALEEGRSIVHAREAVTGPFRDQSCLARHAADPWMCSDNTHVRLNHITTPFYQRMDLLDPLSFNRYEGSGLTHAEIAPWTRATALRVPAARRDGEEAASMTRIPAIYAPACGQHVGITSTAYTHVATVLDPGGTAWTVHDSLVRWLAGNNVGAVDTLQLPRASTCPPTTGDDS